ncbi:MAG: hypothetical protein COZ70_07320 [Deltaproteobacteria bacterium CG_4_8_14_3_um_filter_51_11]|nr:hypothetical protein [Deltaproteobacteria bacterium]PIP47045.1 MAG: hypothetical protein COX16_06530 [Deltaproteobacteria bacterium CG23_combo_of_CG06-09_8_20_14_all_51_20]PIW01017.1 MAG: hypothetical protein COW41_03760 [Deltaproteobacteria bacterium CG17_big_fil_post_rev_8_21_14_2_50_51_6]PIX19754.1 MAG: hypothetical protein COZ70_07320 [Deltaproteobacteria bacterium CG_4_8_14_3_um_filter_51_11]PIY26696.1 MAG: hypothetical protein COZ11_01980 [Deltaproteobacteria bacterium CG_4_10_14_3_um_
MKGDTPSGQKQHAGELKEDAYACVSVTETGCGMDMETMEKVFDTFFSTKFTGRGLGLPVALGLVKAHDGAVRIESKPGKGTTLQVFLPLARENIICAFPVTPWPFSWRLDTGRRLK